jgi:hypothetical protein
MGDPSPIWRPEAGSAVAAEDMERRVTEDNQPRSIS